MDKCEDDFIFDKRFGITGRGKTEEDAKKDFDEKLKAKLEELKASLNCEKKVCLPAERRVSTSLRPVVMEFSEHFHLR